MTGHLRRQRGWLTLQRLPGYAPDLNPAECLWGNVKGQELANLCVPDLGAAAAAAHAGMVWVRHSQQLCFAFLHQAGLFF